jgi:uncharacterized protein (DUF1800 family)
MPAAKRSALLPIVLLLLSSPSALAIAPPPAPAAVTALGGDRHVVVSWSSVSGATSYQLFRSQTSGSYSSTPTATTGAGVTTFTDSGLENGPRFFYTIRAVNADGASPRSPQASAYTEAPRPLIDAADAAAFRLLRHATWGMRPGDVDRVRLMGHAAYIDDQLSAAPSDYPDTLVGQAVSEVQKHFVHLALTAPDQLRQRVAWALQKIWVASASDPNAALGMLAYERLFVRHAFGNYRDLMEAVTLNPAMGRYLTMLNNRSEAITGAPANENYARELMQLFTLGTVELNLDGTPVLSGGRPVPSYSEQDVAALARIMTGWTFGDGNLAARPSGLASANYLVAMEPVTAFHDTTAKVFLGQTFSAGGDPNVELGRALDLIFQHRNVAPFVAKQLIKQLVTSNPTVAYVRDVAAVFENNGRGVRGDLAAVVRAVLLHPEGTGTAPISGKLQEPILFMTIVLRTLNASVTNLQYAIDRGVEMGQRVLYPPSVFSYFSPGFTVRDTNAGDGSPLTGPEFQILTGVTSFERPNFVSRVLDGSFGTGLVFDLSPFLSRARDAAALVDYCDFLFTGGRLTPATRADIIAAVRAISITSTVERGRTAIYLTLATGQFQVDR